MASSIPPKLKSVGITPFVVRAIQLESARPVISYWCYYWAVQQILKSQLHNADQDCLQFTTNIMDKLEEMKTTNADNDTILDDVAGQAYVEQFAQETFDRALRPLKANKVTQQTATTFEAAATFFQLVNIWGQPEPETQEKIKYAKWNAARILKAIKEGKDPNESNPKQEDAQLEESNTQLDPNALEAELVGPPQSLRTTVEEVPDDGGVSSHGRNSSYSLNAAVPPVSAPNSPPLPSVPAPEAVSPIAPPDVPSREPGSYFPVTAEADQSPLDLPSTTGMPPPGPISHDDFGSPPEIPSPSSHRPLIPPPSESFGSPGIPSSTQDYYHQPPQHPGAPSAPFLPPQQHYPPSQAPSAPQSYQTPYVPPSAPPPVSRPPPPSAPMVQQTGGGSGSTGPYNYDDMAIAKAQKHAKWAISALNFEDVPTAVRELQAALATLGAQ